MYRIISAIPRPDLSLDLTFADGHSQHIDIRPFAKGPLSQSLASWEFFRQVTIDSGGGLVWPNGYDICPNLLREQDVNSIAQSAPPYAADKGD